MVTSISPNTGGNLQEMFRSLQKGQKETLEASATETLAAHPLQTANAQSTVTQAMSSNLMSRNFASSEREESKYVNAALVRLKVDQQVETQQQNTLTSIMQQARLEYEQAETSGEKFKALKRAEKQINWNQESEIRKSAEKTHLKKSKESLEENVQEIMENGKALEGTAAASTQEATPKPEISSSAQAPIHDTGTPPAPEAAEATTVEASPAPEISTPTASTTPSVNITV